MSDRSVPPHPLETAVRESRRVLLSVGDVDPMFMRAEEQIRALNDMLALESQLAELKARLLNGMERSGDVVATTAAGELRFWLANYTRLGIPGANAELRFARRLADHPATAAAMRDGTVSSAQAAVVIAALDALPEDLPDHLRARLSQADADGATVAARAESRLLDDALTFAPRELKVLGRRILEVVAPEMADEAEARALEAAERRAQHQTRLTFLPHGDGTTSIRGRVPDLAAAQLRTMLDSLINPRRRPAWVAPQSDGGADDDPQAPEVTQPRPWWARPTSDQLGHAFIELISRIPTDVLPTHGNTAATLFVTVTVDHLRSGLGAAVVHGARGEELISASEARRLACHSGLIPAVLGSDGEVLDLGRRTRLFSSAQTRALRLRHRHCQGHGCTRPSAHCEAHHHQSWLDGGPTDLANALLLCNRCHHRAHDPRLDYAVDAAGVVVFTPRGDPP